MDGATAPSKSKVHVDGWLRKIAVDFADGNAAVIEAMRHATAFLNKSYKLCNINLNFLGCHMKSLQPRHFTKPCHRKTAPNTIIACGTYTILLRHSVRLPNACSTTTTTFIQSTILSRAPKNHVLQNAKNNDDDDDLFFFLFGNKCRVSAAKFLDCSRTSKTPFDFSLTEETKRKKISFFLSLSLSVSLCVCLF